MKTPTVLFCYLVFLFPLASSSTQVFLDQRQVANDSAWIMAPFDVSYTWAFRFVPSHDNVAGAGIFIQSYDNTMPWNLTLTLWDDLPNVGHRLASGTTTVTTDSFIFNVPLSQGTDV